MTFSTCDLCDEHEDKLRVVDPLFADFGGRSVFSGRIATIKCHEDNSLVRECVAEAGYGRVLVIDGGGSTRRALLGDMLAEKAASNGWAGVIVYGAVRDIEIMETIDLGVKALCSIPLKTEKKGIGERDIAVRFGGVDFVPGHFLYADRNGIVVSSEDLLP